MCGSGATRDSSRTATVVDESDYRLLEYAWALEHIEVTIAELDDEASFCSRLKLTPARNSNA